MAESVVSFAVQRLTDLLIQEALFLNGVSEEVQSIQTELRRMQCFLKDADSRLDEDESVRNWVSEIRDLAYHAEDIIEDFALKVASRRRNGILNKFNRFLCILDEGLQSYNLRRKIQVLNTKIFNLTTRLETYGIRDLRNAGNSGLPYHRHQQLRRSYSHVVERHIIRREDRIKPLVGNLVKMKKSGHVVSIWGMGGLGKTTLAKDIYHHSVVRSHFNYFAWSCISQQCQARETWEGILIKLLSPSLEEREEIVKLRDDELARKLYQIQQEKKCLVILDDIWSIQAWDSLKAAFPIEETDSRILLTTRKKEVASYVDSSGSVYELQCLNSEESWDLFQRIAIPQRDGTDLINNKRMEELGKQMVGHCAGLPLAITVLGGLLATKYTLNEWQVVHDNIKSYMRRGKVHGEERPGVLDVLALSYDDLPAQLKSCFLYLGHFPEDYEIPAVKVIQMWMAEGFIPLVQLEGNGEESMEEIAERHLNELVERCMIQVGEMDANLKIKNCRMHDLMRDLCLEKAKQENFLRIINHWNRDEDVPMLSSSSTGVVRRVSVHLNRERRMFNHKKSITNPQILRSLLYFYEINEGSWQIFWELTTTKFYNLKVLRVLDLEGAIIYGGRLPKDIDNLIHLRFLSIKDSKVSGLPSTIGSLRRLQTLNLCTKAAKIFIPNVIQKLQQLRHLYLPLNLHRKTKLKLARLRNLRTLVNFHAENCYMEDLVNMTNLRQLNVVYPDCKNSDEALKLPNATLKYLRSLSIVSNNSRPVNVKLLLSSFSNICELNLCGYCREMKVFPDYQDFPPNFSYIRLQSCKLIEDPMATLGKLPNLRVLSICENAFIGTEMVCSKEDFPQLHYLLLEGQPKLEAWRVEEGAMPNLCQLTISGCWKLKSYPDALRFATSLQKLEIRSMPRSFKDKITEGGEDFYKVRHVPSVIFLRSNFEKPMTLRLDLHDDVTKNKVMKAVSSLAGVESISIGVEKKLTVTGVVDPDNVVKAVRRFCYAELI